ncbi:hypothetical protein ACLIWX_20700 [Variovorax sp. tm]
MEEQDQEFYRRHEAAIEAAPGLALKSVREMALPKEIHLTTAPVHLGAKVADVVKRTASELQAKYADALPIFFGIVSRDIWFACWKGAHYMRLLHQPLIGRMEIPDESRRMWTPEGYAEVDGWAAALYDELLRKDIRPERIQLRKDTGFDGPIDAEDEMLGMSLYFFFKADESIKHGALSEGFDWLHEAYEAHGMNFGSSMWAGALEEAKEINLEAARSALGKSGALVRHAENRALKQHVFEWCERNMASARSMDAAASLVAGIVVPVAWRTVRDWMAEWKKLRSAGTT